MPIPAFDGISNVLPPHLGDPSLPQDLSPYVCTTMELCSRFATSPARKMILEGFLKLRAELLGLGIRGFHWLDGSFLEDIETQEGRDPQDIDVVTFAAHPDNLADFEAAFTVKPDLLDRPTVKSLFHVDHYLLPLYLPSEVIVDSARYWYGLFSHRRDGTWKGMLRVGLAAKVHDDPAFQVLGSKP